MSNRPRAIAASVLAAVAAGCSSRPAPVVDPHSSAATEQVLIDLSVVTRRRRPDRAELTEWRRKLASGEATLTAYIDHLMRDPTFTRQVMPESLMGDLAGSAASFVQLFVLASTTGPDGPVYHLGEPCDAAAAVRVRPWWDLEHDVLVCPDSYRPDVWEAKSGGVVASCNSIGASLENGPTPCGCGPNLIRCSRPDDGWPLAAYQEVTRTVAHVVEQDLPFATIFSGASTYRDRIGELMYRHERIEQERRTDGALLRDLGSWPTDGKWAPRHEAHPGQHAGVLTSWHLLYFAADKRQRQRVIFERLWCSEPGSAGAMPEDLLSLGATTFQGGGNEGWQELAARQLCTDCHARLDYGFQFFAGYSSPEGPAAHFVASLVADGKKGPLYGRNIDDPRGEAELTPAGFADLAMRQPEFARCMSRRIAAQVLGPDASSDEVKALARDFDPWRTTVRDLTRRALLRFAERRAARSDDATHGAAAVGAASHQAEGGQVALSGASRERLDAACASCHDEDTSSTRRVSFAGASLPRDMVVRMLEQVAIGRMPKELSLRPARRAELIELLIADVWNTEKERQAARRHFLAALSPPTAHPLPTARGMIRAEAGAPAGPAGFEATDRWNSIEQVLDGSQTTYTPGYAAMVKIEALRACKAAGKTGNDALKRCVKSASRSALFLRAR